MNVFQLLPVVVAAAIVFGLRRARPGSELLPGVAMVAWFAIVLVLAQTGVLAQFDKLPPRIPFIALGGVAVLAGGVELRAQGFGPGVGTKRDGHR